MTLSRTSVAGLPALPTATPPGVPTGQGPAVAGQRLYVAYGCITCHGPTGSVEYRPSVARQDHTAASGDDLPNEFNTDAKIIDVIRSGSVIGRAPIVSMSTGAASFTGWVASAGRVPQDAEMVAVPVPPIVVGTSVREPHLSRQNAGPTSPG